MRFQRHRLRAANGPAGTPIEALESRRLMTAVVVNSVTDAVGGNLVTLRDAVAKANASATPTTITFDPGVFSSNKTILLAQGYLKLTNTKEPTTVVGPVAGVTVNANKKSAGLFVDYKVTATLRNMTFTGGAATQVDDDTGGGIVNSGTLTLTAVTVTGNAALDYGGGISNYGKLTLLDASVVDNANTVGRGGGIYNAGTATLTNVTVSGNSTKATGAGIGNDGLITLANVTVADNRTDASGGCGGVFSSHPYAVSVGNSIVAGNAGPGGNPDLSAAVNSFGNNLVGVAGGDLGLASDDQHGTAAKPLDPKLGALADHGGLTPTMLPQAGSPAVDAGSTALVAATVTADQRGLYRVYGKSVDVGAAEFQLTIVVGTVFKDTVTKNGKRDAGELGLAGWKVYDDVGNKGSFVAGDPFAFTDAAGNYRLDLPGTGTAYVRQVVPTNWTQTGPAAGAANKVTLVAGGALRGAVDFGDYTAVKYLGTVATTPGLVAWWTFDGSSQANSVVNGYTGTLKGGAKVAAGSGAPISGETTSGLSLNGTGAYVDTNLTNQVQFATVHQTTTGGKPTFYTTAAATYNVWVNFGSTPAAPGHVYAILAKSQFGDDLDLQLEPDGKIHFYTDNGSSAAFAPASLTGWHMLTAEFDTAAKTRQIFWDGKLAASTNPYAGAHGQGTNPFSIGASDVFAGRYDKGSLDEVSLWNRALTAAEVQAIYNSSK